MDTGQRLLSNTGVVILAGGVGSRVRQLYPLVPKPMIEVCGQPFIEWVIRYFANYGLRDFSLSLGYKANVIDNYINFRQKDALKLFRVREETPLGTAGGFVSAASELSDKDFLLVANGDSLVLTDLLPALRRLLNNSLDAVIVGCKMRDCSRYGSFEINKDGMLSRFREKQKGEGIINAGVYIFPKESLKVFPEKRPLSFEYDVFPEFLGKGMKISIQQTDAPFIDIGTPDSVIAAEDFIKKHRKIFNSEA